MGAAPIVASAERRKALGAFYTPRPMAEKLVEWAVRTPDDTVLDPSSGGLVFLAAAKRRLEELGGISAQIRHQLHGCELDEDVHGAAVGSRELGLPEEAILQRDFFATTAGQDLPRARAVVGNPPYIRFQSFDQRREAAHLLARDADIPFTGLTSSWAPFLVHSASFVAPGGRLAVVLPAELLHAQYADGVLDFVESQFRRTTVVVFERRVFPGALEEVLLLLAEGRGEGQSRAEMISVDTLDDLDLSGLHSQPPPTFYGKPAGKRPKLLFELLPPGTRGLYRALADSDGTSVLGDLASVDIGAVTGSNQFFMLRRDEEPGLSPELLQPAVSKAVQLRGARFTERDYLGLLNAEVRCRLFVADASTDDGLLATARSYLARGSREGVRSRYKCRVREPRWWAVPLPKHGAPALFLTYCSSEHPRLVLNEARTLHTNTVHGVTLSTELAPAALAVGFHNSLSLLSAELVGRSYGGGVLKLEPTEAEALVVPVIPEAAADSLAEVDRLMRGGDLEGVLDVVDPLVLGPGGLGLSKEDIAALRAGAERLRARRRARGRAPSKPAYLPM